MYVQDQNGTRRDRLEVSWVDVRDDRGRIHVEARWTRVPRPAAAGSVQAA